MTKIFGILFSGLCLACIGGTYINHWQIFVALIAGIMALICFKTKKV